MNDRSSADVPDAEADAAGFGRRVVGASFVDLGAPGADEKCGQENVGGG
jgi:hypothetical protein